MVMAISFITKRLMIKDASLIVQIAALKLNPDQILYKYLGLKCESEFN